MRSHHLICLLSLLILITPVAAQSAPDCAAPLTIAQIQGAGGTANCLDESISTEGVVTGFANLGFFIQSLTPDDDSATSEGIFVFTNYPPRAWGLDYNQQVRVEGRVKEFYGLSQITVAGQRRVTVLDDISEYPDPVDLLSINPATLESLEGMLIEVREARVVAPTNQFDEFGISLTGEKAFREAGIETDIMPQYAGMGLPEWDLNQEIVEVDPPEMGHPVEQVTPNTTFSGIGFLSYAFNDYQFWPIDYSLDISAARPIRREVRIAEAGEYTIATQNVENLYDLRDDPAIDDSSFEDYVPDSEEDYQRKLLKVAFQINDMLRAPDIVALQEVEGIDALNDLITTIAGLGEGIQYTGCLIEGNDSRGIDSAFLWQADRVTVNACEVMPGAANAVGVYGGGQLHDRPPLVLDVTLQGTDGPFDITIINLHNKSLSGIDTTATQLKRLEQAIDVAEYVQTLQDRGMPVLLIGDFNAFQFSDGLVDVTGIIQGTAQEGEALHVPESDLVEPNLINLLERVPPEERYSFYFNSMAQQLEQTLVTADLDLLVTGIEHSRGNADATRDNEALDNPFRSADHDGVVVYVKP